ncbi:MAG: dephospho-CoA kinase [Bacteroidaceae bacterium]|nr:dephospho-CoA kinase [Bacteroidaceae bacterium]
MIKIGITGGIGAGKSYICNLLKQRGIPVYNCDEEAKRLMGNSPLIKKKLTQIIGENAYTHDNALNKPAIAKFLFANDKNAAIINSIVHPVVKQDFIDWANKQDSGIVVQESALLFESNFDKSVDITIEVYAPTEVRLERAIARDKSSAQQIKSRMAQQMDEEEKRHRADFCIINDGATNLEEQIEFIISQIVQSKK